MQKFEGRICVPAYNGLRTKMLEEAHKGEFTIHLEAAKMYQDLQKMF